MKRTIIFTLVLVILCSVMSTAAFAETQYGYVKTPTSDGTVYVRAVAGAGQPVKGVAKNGDSLVILKKGNTWHKVRVERTGLEGYMYGLYIVFTKTTSGGTDTVYKADPSVKNTDTIMNLTGTISSSDGYANLRWGPGTNYASMGSLTNGKKVWVLDQNGNWYRCRLTDGRVCYISAKLVKTGETYNDMDGAKGIVRSSDGYASVRTGPGTSYSELYRVYAGNSVQAYSANGSWLCLNGYGSWGAEYIYRTLVRFFSKAKTTGNVYMRVGPDKTTQSVGVLNKGTTVHLLATDGNFARVDTGSRIAYVSMKYLSVESEK